MKEFVKPPLVTDWNDSVQQGPLVGQDGFMVFLGLDEKFVYFIILCLGKGEYRKF